jgi:nucleotide-binding universal stress UspA family protein
MKMEIDRDLIFSSIVFGTDFSESSQRAGRYAALFARHFNADLIVAHAFTLVQPAREVEALSHIESLQRTDLEHLLAETLAVLGPLAGKAATVLGEGSPIELIRAISEQHRPSLVVLGTHGGGMLERHIVGSVAEGILRTIDSPVLTVGPRVPLVASGQLAFRRILYATDLSPAAAHAGPYAMALARAFGSTIDVLHVVPPEATGQPDEVRTHEHAFLSAMQHLLPERAADLWRSRTLVESGNVPERIIQHMSEDGVDLIVLGAHHHSWLARHLKTGPAFQIIRVATCPVLTIAAPPARKPSSMTAPP